MTDMNIHKINNSVTVEVGDIVSFMTRAHPIMGEPYEVIGRVQRFHDGLVAGGRRLPHSGEVTIIQKAQSRLGDQPIPEDFRHAYGCMRDAIGVVLNLLTAMNMPESEKEKIELAKQIAQNWLKPAQDIYEKIDGEPYLLVGG